MALRRADLGDSDILSGLGQIKFEVCISQAAWEGQLGPGEEVEGGRAPRREGREVRNEPGTEPAERQSGQDGAQGERVTSLQRTIQGGRREPASQRSRDEGSWEEDGLLPAGGG